MEELYHIQTYLETEFLKSSITHTRTVVNTHPNYLIERTDKLLESAERIVWEYLRSSTIVDNPDVMFPEHLSSQLEEYIYNLVIKHI